MDEKLLSKLVEVLKSHGLGEEDIEKVKAELTEEGPKEESTETESSEEVETETPTEESSVAEGEEKPEESAESKPVESEETEVEEKVEESPVEEEPVSEEPKMEEPVEPVSEEPVEPQPEEEPSDLPPGVSEVDPSGDLPPVEEPTEPQQPDYQSLVNQLEEERKAREGLLARIDALESALKESGVMSERPSQPSPVGVDDPTRVADYHDDDASFEATLREINKPQY